MKSSHLNPNVHSSKHQRALKQPKPSKKVEKITLEGIINLFQSCKAYFTQTIQRKSEHQDVKSKYSEGQNYRENGACKQQDNQILKMIEGINSMESSQFHFNEEQMELIFEEALILCCSMIEQHENNHNYKKSRTLKRFLTKFLLQLSRFLVQKILRASSQNFSIYLNKAINILLDAGSTAQSSREKKPNSKRQSHKKCHFYVPLLLTNCKIPFSFYFIFKVLQQKLLNQSSTEKSNTILETLHSYVHSICEDILSFDNHHELGSLLIKTVCQSLGCFQLPIVYLFHSSILLIIEKEFTEKYESMNNQSLQLFKFEKEIFSLKNLGFLLESLIRHENDAFKQIRVSLVKGEQYKCAIDELTGEQLRCFWCQWSLPEMIVLKFERNKVQKAKKEAENEYEMKLAYCKYCFWKKQDPIVDEFHLSNCQKQKRNVLVYLFSNSFWRQEFELKEIQEFKTMNLTLLQNSERTFQSNSAFINNQLDNNIKTKLAENQLAFFCLKTLYLSETPSKKSHSKKTYQISLKSLQQKLVTLFLILLNSKNQSLRLQTIKLVSKDQISRHFTQYLDQAEISSILTDSKQLHQNKQMNNDAKYFLKNKVIQLFDQIKYRIFDNSELIQTESMKFLLKIRSFYSQAKLKLEIFEFIMNNFKEKVNGKTMKTIPMDIIRIFSSQVQMSCEQLKTEPTLSQIVTVKHLISKILSIILSLLDSLTTSKSFQGDQIRQIILIARGLIQKMLWLINLQQKETNKNSNKLQYQNLVICYLKEFTFTKATINCFKLNDTIIEKLISLTEQNSDQNQSLQIQTQQQNDRLLKNLKLILGQIFEFSKEVVKNPAVSESLQKINTKKSKVPKVNFMNNEKDLEIDFDSNKMDITLQNSCFNLNKIIKNILKREAKLNPLNCEILFLLIQKNILLNYESEGNIQDTPSKIKRLILSLQTIRKFNEILLFLEKEIKECNADLLSTYIKLYVVICIQINQQRKLQMLFIFYLNAFRYFKKNWLIQYKQQIDSYQQSPQRPCPSRQKSDLFFLRTLRTISLLATQHEKFKKIQYITDNYYSQLKNTNNNDKKYSIFSKETQDAINSLDTQPEQSFVQLYEQVHSILHFLIDDSIPEKYSALVNESLKILSMIITVHPHLFDRISSILKSLPKCMTLSTESLSYYLTIFLQIISTKDSLLISSLSNSYKTLKDLIFETNENQSLQKYQNFQKFYKITFELLMEDVIGIRDLSVVVFYGLFTKNKKINDWTKNCLEYLNQKGTDGVLLNDFEGSILKLSQKIGKIDESFFSDKQLFRNVSFLGQINKERHKKQKVFLQKDLKEMKIRSTFIKKTAEFFSKSFNKLNNFSDLDGRPEFLMLKIIENQEQMDVFQLQQIIEEMQEVIRDNFMKISRTNDQYIQQEDKQANQLKEQQLDEKTEFQLDKQYPDWYQRCDVRRQIFFVGQMMYTLIKLINEKKLKPFKKDLEKVIEAKKFTSSSINLPVNNFNQEKKNFTDQNLTEKNQQNATQAQAQQFLFNYQECIEFTKELHIIRDTRFQTEEQATNALVRLTIDFKEVAKKMYSVLFEDEKPKIPKVIHQSLKRAHKKKARKALHSGDSDEENTEYTQSLNDERSLSRQNSTSKTPSHLKTTGTKRINTRLNPITKNDNNATKKATMGAKNFGHSLPKKLQKRLNTINELISEEEHVTLGGKESRRSKRLLARQKQKRQNSQSQFR